MIDTTVKYSKISDQRNPLMGLAAILILVVHASINIDNIPHALVKILEQGNYGVDIFFFLSGMGLSYSLHKFEAKEGIITFSSKGIWTWLRSRYKRVLIPYLLITALFSVYCILFEGRSYSYAFLHLSTLAYWLTGIGAWFISTLVILYLFTPFIYCLIYKRKLGIFVAFIIGIVIMIVCQYEDKEGIIRNIMQGFVRVPAFLLGIAYAPYIMHRTEKSVYFVLMYFVLGVGVTCILKYTFPAMYSKWILILPITILFSYLISTIRILEHTASFFGKISLESYLYNIYLSTILLHKSWIVFGLDLSYNHYVEYAVVLILGTVFSYLTSLLLSKYIR